MGQIRPSQSLLAAAKDARFLLDNGYARETVLKLTADRYLLDAGLRQQLRRGVFGPREAAARMARLMEWEALAGVDLGVDGHNQLITLENALAQKTLVLADDGCVRDTAALGRNHRPGEQTRKAAAILIEELIKARVKKAVIYLHAPLPKSGELAAGMERMMQKAGLNGSARAVKAPERILKEHEGPVASSDSALLDAVSLPVDLAGIIISRRWPGLRLLRLST